MQMIEDLVRHEGGGDEGEEGADIVREQLLKGRDQKKKERLERAREVR